MSRCCFQRADPAFFADTPFEPPKQNRFEETLRDALKNISRHPFGPGEIEATATALTSYLTERCLLSTGRPSDMFAKLGMDIVSLANAGARVEVMMDHIKKRTSGE